MVNRNPSSDVQEPRKGFVVVGRVRSSWSRLGEIRVQLFTDNPQRFSSGQTLYIHSELYTIQRTRFHKGDVLLKLQGVDCRDEAEALQYAWIDVPRESLPTLPKDTYYHFHLIGMEVWTSEGAFLGNLVRILETGSNDVYLIQNGPREVLLPSVGEVIRQVDVENGWMVVNMLPGL